MIVRSLLLLFGLLSSHAAGRDFSDDERARLQDRDVLIEDVTNEEGIRGLRTAFLIKARPEAIWNLLVDHKHKRFREVFTDVKELSELRENQAGAEVRFRVGYAFWKYEYVLQRNFRQPGWRLTWQRVSGDWKSITGEWVIHKWPDDNHQLVICNSFVDTGNALTTNAAVRALAAAGMRNTARRMREQLEPGGK